MGGASDLLRLHARKRALFDMNVLVVVRHLVAASLPPPPFNSLAAHFYSPHHHPKILPSSQHTCTTSGPSIDYAPPLVAWAPEVPSVLQWN